MTASRGKGASGRGNVTRLAGWLWRKLGHFRQRAQKLKRRDLDHAPGPFGFVP